MSLSGTYETNVKSPMGDQKSTLTVDVDGAAFKGTSAAAAGTQDIDGSVEGSTLRWEQKVTSPMAMTLSVTATIDGDTLTGSVKAGAFGSFPMTGTRVA